MPVPTHPHHLAAALAVAAAVLTACSSSPSPASAAYPSPSNDDYTAAAEPAPRAHKVGDTVDLAGVTITLAALKTAPANQVNPADYGKPATWRGVLATWRITNTTTSPIRLDATAHISSDPDTTPGMLGEWDGPGGTGTTVLGNGAIPPGRARTAVTALLLPTTRGIVIDLSPGITPAAAQPTEDPITWTGDAQ